ncbi:MAG: hypothetical protein Q8J68_07795 [Methanolobus sp.]|uniref:hypothetical protein n=1 Tax=Methanolobus sp. TaxID=1874737 RepID=UPI0027303069|nr:hypothetical protein [Methanolobus sp.]MDP2217170.1 hypothetical protein [Methanolobus sp.]
MDNTKEIIRRLDRSFTRRLKRADYSDHEACTAFQHRHGMKGWEIFFMPEEMNYDDCLSKLSPDDVVFDVGAGDLRFDLMMAEKVKKVYAVEINPNIIAPALHIIGYDLPVNLIPICADAFKMELPRDVTVVTCLMIHREQDFTESWKKCRTIYARKDGVVEVKAINHAYH